MFLRTANPARADSSEASGREDLRRQLEGGLEVIEAALARYRTLSSALGRRGWKAKLRLQSAMLEEAVTREPAVLEALAALKRRVAHGPDMAGAAQALLREVESSRDALSAALARRLPVSELPLLSARLERLKAVALRPLPLPPGQEELRLLEGQAVLPPPGLRVSFLLLGVLVHWLVSPWAATPLMVLAFTVTYLRSGKYWLTPERLFWQPRRGDPVEVPLASIQDSTRLSSGLIERNLSVNRFTGDVTLHRQGLTLRHVPQADQLAALLSIRRRKEFRRAWTSQDPRLVVVVVPVFRSRSDEAVEPMDREPDGLLVLRPGFVAFFSNRAASDVLDAITEPERPAWRYGRIRDDVPISIQQLVDQLLLLPEVELDRMLRDLATLRQRDPLYGAFWVCKSNEVRCTFNTLLQTLDVSHGECALWANLSGQDRQRIAHVLSLLPTVE